MFVIKKGISLKEFNTFGVDVSTQFYAQANTLEKIIFSINFASYNHLSILPQGAGSNTLYTSDYQGIIVHPAIKCINIAEDLPQEVIVRCGAGVAWDDFVEYCVSKGLYGVENLSHIPGDVGAAPVQNIGAYGVELKDVVHKIDAIDIETRKSVVFKPEECQFGYRSSIFKHELRGRVIITHVWFKLKRKSSFTIDYGNLRQEVEALGEPSLQTVRQAVINIRSNKLPDPRQLGSAGSFFKNPIVEVSRYNAISEQYSDVPKYDISAQAVKIPAGWLIEQCGWKGKRVGNCGVYPKQALILVNYGGATGQEILNLAHLVKNDVKQKFQIDLDFEVNIV